MKFEEECSNMSDKFGINMFFEKKWFIDSEDLNTTWVGLDEHIGESMVSGENQNILQKLKDEAHEIPEDSFEHYLNNIEDMNSTVIIMINSRPYDFFGDKYDSNTYISNWSGSFSDKWLKEFPEGLEGIFKYRQYRIPVYEYFIDLPFEGLLIADFRKLILSQYPLGFEGKERYIMIDVQGFKSGSSEEDEFIKNAPEWLKQIGDEDAQRNYLEERVIVKVFEQFDLIINKSAVAKILFK